MNTNNNLNAVRLVSGDIYINLTCHNCSNSNGYDVSGKAILHILELNVNPNNPQNFNGSILINRNGTSILDFGEVNQSSKLVSSFLGLGGQINIECKQLGRSGGGHIFDMRQQSFLVANMGTINFSDSGDVFHLESNASINALNINCGDVYNVINIIDNGSFNATIQGISVNQGSVLISTSISTSQLNFNVIYSNGGNLSGILFNLTGQGSISIVGASINANSHNNVFLCQRQNLDLILQKLSVNEANIVFNLLGSNSFLDIDDLRINSILTTAVISASDFNNNPSNIFVHGMNFNVNTSLVNLPTFFLFNNSSIHADVNYINHPGIILNLVSGERSNFRFIDIQTFTSTRVILVDNTLLNIIGGNVTTQSTVDDTVPAIEIKGNSAVIANFNHIFSRGPALSISSNNEVWYNAVRTITFSSNRPAIVLASPGSNAIQTISGYIKTDGSNAIESNGIYQLRLLNSTLISTSLSISSTAPLNVSSSYSIANQNYNLAGGTLSGVLTVDSGIF